MALDPQQALFTALLLRLRELHPKDVYDTFLPPKGTPYPFIYIGNSTMIDDFGNKTQILGTVDQTFEVWHDDPMKRGTVSALLGEIKKVCYEVERTNGFSWSVDAVTQNILPDNSTGTPLLHGLLTVTFRLLGGQDED